MNKNRKISLEEILPADLTERELIEAIRDVSWIKDNMVTKAEFNPVKRIVFWGTGVLSSIVAGVIITITVKVLSRWTH